MTDLKPMTDVKRKYRIGDKVLVPFTIGMIYAEDDDYVLRADDGSEVYCAEADIYGLAPVDEPTKPGSVVVVAGASWTFTGNESAWYNAYEREYSTWDNLTAEGTPKVVWEPASADTSGD